MRRKIWGGTFVGVAFALAVGVLAQQASQGQETAGTAAVKSFTVTGCIERAEPAPTGTTGEAAGAVGEAKFLLTGAERSSAAGAATSGATGTAGATASPEPSQYRLDADEAKLAPHVGHKVEITGTVAQPSSAAAPETAASPAKPPMLKVESVRMIAESCSK